jgi:hypothetical protein
MIKEILIVSLSTTSLLFLIAYSFMTKKSSKLAKEITTLYIDNLALKKFIDNEIDNKITSQDVHNENFVKFLSDSREVAYSYIEDVQSGLNKFVSDVEPEINYFKEYGDLMGMHPNYYSLKKITEAYEELKKLLPKDEEEVK